MYANNKVADINQGQIHDPHYGGSYPGESVVVGQPQHIVVTQQVPVYGNDNMGLSILTCLFCFWPLGIVAIVMSSMASSSYASGNYEEGRKYAKIAGWLSFSSCMVVVVSIIVIVIVFISTVNQ